MAFFKANYVTGSSPIEIKSFSQATDAEITAMLTAVRNGDITYQDLVDGGWTVGAERPVSLSAMAATGVGESHVAQTATWVILHGKDFFTLNEGGKNLFVVGLKNSLKETGHIDIVSGGWDDCGRRIWCNNVFKNAIPSEELNWFKQFKVKASNGNKSTSVTESTDWFSLPSRAEVYGGSDTSNTPDAEGTTILDYYLDTSKRIKKLGDDGVNAYHWWLRSPYVKFSYYFCFVRNDGSLDHSGGGSDDGLSPFGCL